MRSKSTGPLQITCPHLGMKQDRSTAFAYPSPGNYCYNCKVPTSPAEDHQERFCLTTARNECPVYNQEENNTFPQDLVAVSEPNQNSFHVFGKFLWPLLVVIISIIIYYVISNSLNKGKIGAIQFLLPTTFTPLSLRGTRISTQTFSLSTFTTDHSLPTMTSHEISSLLTTSPRTYSDKTPYTTQSLTLGFSPSNTQTRISTPSSTQIFSLPASPKPALTITPQRRNLEEPFIVNNQRFIIHLITSNENYEVIARIYNTKVDILQAINYQAPSPLWIKSTIIIAPGLLTKDLTIPALQADLVTEKSTNIETLAKKYNVSLDLMKQYNNCLDNCTLFTGDWVLIPHTR